MAFFSRRVHISLISNDIQRFHRIAKVWSLTLYLSIILTVVPIAEANSTCTVNGIHYICSNIATKTDFPPVLPKNVRKVMLNGTDELYKSFPDACFDHPTWANVSELSIIEFTDVEYIERGFLKGLEVLKFLSISSCTDLTVVDPDIFYYTPSIEALHLDGNTRLRLSVVEAALTDKLNNLRYLSLIGIQASEQHIVLGDTFLKALHGKNLTYFDISGVNVLIVEHAVLQNLFANLKYLNVSYSKAVAPVGMYYKIRMLLQNIEVLDFTGVQYIINKYSIQSGEQLIEAKNIPKAMYLFIQGLVHPDTKVRVHIRYICENSNFKAPKMLDVSKNSFNILNISFLGNCSAPELETLNLASNDMEYISRNILSVFPSLKILDMSNNLLMKMQDMDEFSDMFSQNKDLEIIYLRNNHFTFVPSNLFLFNSRLLIIDLSNNELDYLNINLHNSLNLKLINLRNNRLKSLPASTLGHFDALFRNQQTESHPKTYATNLLLKQFQDKSLIGKQYRYVYKENEAIQFEESHNIIPQYLIINILDNQFVCDCDTLVLMEWILFTYIEIVNKTILSCTHSSNKKSLNNELFQMVKINCRLASIIGIVVASLVAILLIISTIAITIRLRYKSARRNHDVADLVNEIQQENAHFKYLVFLSYCSQDSQIVEENILPSLNRNLHEMFNTEKDLVCTGETSFVPGMRIIEEIHRCIDQSLVVVPVITPAFLQSDWSQEECVAAVERHKRVVILMKKHTDTSSAIHTIQHLIGQYTRGTWSENEGVFVIRPSCNTICEGIRRAASESFRQYRRHNLIEPAEDNPLVEEIL